jgi:hypothetical protein
MAQTFIQSADIGTGEILAGNIGSGAVTTAKIANNAVTAALLANNTITATQIANNTITATQIANTTITASQIANQTITATQIANTTITGAQIASAAVTAAKADLTGAWSFSNLQGTLGANLNANSNTITNLPTPTNNGDAASKSYVDTQVQSAAAGLDVKGSCVAATTANLTATYNNGASGVGATLTASANGTLTIDGFGPVTVGQRLLVKDQTTGFQNGIYSVTDAGSAGTPWILTRANDFDTANPGNITPNAFTFIEQGTTQADTQWVLTTNSPITVGTTALVFSQFGAASAYVAGNGLLLTGNSFSVKANTGASGGIVNAVDITSNGVAIKVDNSTIAGDGGGNLQIKAAGVDFAQLSTSVKTGIGQWQGHAVFTGDNTATVFTIGGSLTNVSTANNGIQVSVNGVIKLRGALNDYTSDANGAITFAVAPANGASIQVYYGQDNV